MPPVDLDHYSPKGMDKFDVAWTADPARIARSHTQAFIDRHHIESYSELVARSISEPEWFWSEVIAYLGLPFSKAGTVVKDESRGLPWTTWWPDARFNLSVACVDRWAEQSPQSPAVRGLRETGELFELDFASLAEQVSKLAGALSANGVGRGDAVAVFLPMSVEAVVSFLAVARIGAIFIPVFSGYAPEAVATRLDNPRPKMLICADGFTRRGRPVHSKEVADAAVELAGGIDKVIVVDYLGRTDTPRVEGRDLDWTTVVGSAEPLPAVPTAAEEPVMIAYTSGTTGRPKGAVHVHGGLTIKLAAEGAFQLEVTDEDVLMWFTDMGWIMGPWMVVAGLANGACIAVYDGAPDFPQPDRVWEVVSQLGVTIFGVSPTLIRSLQPHGSEMAKHHDLSSIRTFGSTGEPWNPEPWWWLFTQIGGGELPIINISGGTEIGACILSSNILQGIKPTSLGGPALGVAADIVDSAGHSVRGEVGELVIRGSWPGMTRGFWGDPQRYLDTYWSRLSGVWVHGDWASVDDDGFWYLHGRSDDTLNIAGKRVGPTEIESIVVALPGVTMAAVVGLPDATKGETLGVYVVANPDWPDPEELPDRVSAEVVAKMGKAFRPAVVELVGDLPRTRSQKIMRRIVRAAALGDDPGDLTGLENPEIVGSIPRI